MSSKRQYVTEDELLQEIGPDAYSCQRLQHADPHHLSLTSRRVFIGPLPSGWLRSHRRDYYKQYIGINSTSERPTFVAENSIVDNGQLAGLEEPVEDDDETQERNNTAYPRCAASLDDASATIETQAGLGPADEIQGCNSIPESRGQMASLDAVSSKSPRPPSPADSGNGTKPLLHNQTTDGELHPPATQDGSADNRAAENSGTRRTRRRPTRNATERIFRKPKVRFTNSSRLSEKEMQMRERLRQIYNPNFRSVSGAFADTRGGIVKNHIMLVRIDSSPQQLPDDFDERECQAVEFNNVARWQEFMVIVRRSKSEGDPLRLQFYRTRVISARDKESRQHCAYEVDLDPKVTRANMFSTIDKSIVVWTTQEKGSRTFLLNPRTAVDSAEWLSLLNGLLGIHQTLSVEVSVPDLNTKVLLQDATAAAELDLPSNESSSDELEDVEKNEAISLADTALPDALIQRCMRLLHQTPEWTSVARQWLKHERVGLAWRRYDMLQWVFGDSERKLFETLSMQDFYSLELRPKVHYPTSVLMRKSGEQMSEPPPLDGFLIRLTNQKGVDQRFGRLFYKRLYFSTHDNFLVYTQPSHAAPPGPPQTSMKSEAKIPSSTEIAEDLPLIYAVNPYPITKNGQLAWPSDKIKEYEQYAVDERARLHKNLEGCDGVIDLSKVRKVRLFKSGAKAADEELEDGSDVDFQASMPGDPQPVPADGATKALDLDRTFELVLANSLVIRLQAYDQKTRSEWIKRLRELVRYWRRRLEADIEVYRATRRINSRELCVDQESEAYLGQYARKWEVTRSVAAPELFSACHITPRCRAIHLSGTLYFKPRRRSDFSRCTAILSNGQLFLFHEALRARTGREIRQIHQEKFRTISLQNTYVFSGLLTGDELLYRNQTFDPNQPGHHALPRIYADGYESTDEDISCCFCIWYSTSRGLFRDPGESVSSTSSGGRRQRLKRVSQLGKTGRIMVFRARSRTEKDRWVASLVEEIGDGQNQNDVRVVGASAAEE